MPARLRACVVFLLCCLWGAGCAPAPVPEPWPAPPVVVEPSPPPGETLADKRLAELKERAEVFLQQWGGPARDASSEADRQATALVHAFELYLSDHPEDVHAYILYGKFLRAIGQRERANMVFLQANELDPQIAVVKQQIANYLAEEGDFALALAYLLAALELAPSEALYHYQLGELLHLYRQGFVAEELFTHKELDQQMLEAFRIAAQLAPTHKDLTHRYAQAQADVGDPDWGQALALWQELETKAGTPLEASWTRLNQARALIQLERYAEAESILDQLTEPALQTARKSLYRELR